MPVTDNSTALLKNGVENNQKKGIHDKITTKVVDILTCGVGVRYSSNCKSGLNIKKVFEKQFDELLVF